MAMIWVTAKCQHSFGDRKIFLYEFRGAVGSLVVRASDSRPEGLGSMPDASEYTRSTCSLSQWVRSLVGLITSAGTGEYFPPLQFKGRNWGGGNRRCRHQYPFEEFRRAKSYCHVYIAQD
ncbi:hypothetical protein TNCV_551921 [Trichonephila clavipes]|nr:hypothetical protein TNCV_551921 [Trichonephila clavipes]